MNIKNTILLLSMASMIACSENIEEEQASMSTNIGVVEDLVPVQFSISDQRVIDFTRAATSIISFDASETVKVFVKPDGATSYSDYDYTTAASGQSVNLTAPATPPYYPPGASTTVEAYAYYPSTASTSFSVASDQTSNANYKASDLMYADNRTVTKGSTDGHDHLAMAHQMAQLAITAQAQAGSGISITGVEVLAKTDVTFDPDPSALARVTTTGNTNTIIALNGAGTGFVLIPPQIINGVVIKVITGAGTSDLIATYAFTGTGYFESGNSYAIDLTVSADQLGFTTSINNWNGVGSVNVTPAGNLTISAIMAQEYTGTALTPSFTVKKGDEVVDPSLYNVTWVNNVNAGKAYIIVAGKGTLEGAVGMASFTITPANGKIEYADNSVEVPYGTLPFIHPLSNVDKRPEHAGQNADGEVTYVSGDQTVATVDPATGEVTLLKAGTTRITATATNGANYVYSTALNEHMSYYDLTVTRAPATISFGYPTPSQPWTDGSYRQEVSNDGDAAVTYSIGSINTCDALINTTTGELTFNKSGSVEVIATIASANTDCYTYSSTTTSYTLTVNKTDGFISISPTSGTVDAGNSIQFNVLTNHGGELSVADVSGNNRTTPSINGTTITVLTTTGIASSGTIRVTCEATECYNAATTDFSLIINRGIDVKMNPLWYMAQYNMKKQYSTPTFAETGFDGHYFSWTDAMSYFAASTTSYSNYRNASKEYGGINYHLPVPGEWWSIVPADGTIFMNYDNGSGTWKDAYISPIWGYNSDTKEGIVESSYWKKVSNSVFHAIRFLGTDYCSAWKYEFKGGSTTSNPDYLEISATLIEKVNNSSTAAATWYNNNFSRVTFGDDETVGAVRRTIYELGYNSPGTSTTPNSGYSKRGLYWSTLRWDESTYGNYGAYGLGLNNTGTGTSGSKEGGVLHYALITYGFTVRLFRDN